MNLEDKLYTSTEVADILGVSLRSVYRYLEEGKLDAEVKTATGRLRFTRQNILDFLRPSDVEVSRREGSRASNVASEAGDTASMDAAAQTVPQPAQPEVAAAEEEAAREEALASEQARIAKEEKEAEEARKLEAEQRAEEAKREEEKRALEEKQREEEASESKTVDWLERFKSSADKFKAQRSEDTSESPAVSGGGTPVTGVAEEEEIVEPESSKPKYLYYRSMIGGLKEIAQNIDKVSRRSNADYVFTMNAGLSLHKPLKEPFSILHVYVRSKDKELYERMLQLIVSDENNAQLCLVLSDDDGLYQNKDEMHGLYVVAKDRLRKDLSDAGKPALAAELD